MDYTNLTGGQAKERADKLAENIQFSNDKIKELNAELEFTKKESEERISKIEYKVKLHLAEIEKAQRELDNLNHVIKYGVGITS